MPQEVEYSPCCGTAPAYISVSYLLERHSAKDQKYSSIQLMQGNGREIEFQQMSKLVRLICLHGQSHDASRNPSQTSHVPRISFDQGYPFSLFERFTVRSVEVLCGSPVGVYDQPVW